METMYETDDYLMAREIPGQVIFTKLVTAEVSIDITNTTPAGVSLSFLVKNEELPLNPNNHCRQVFDLLRVAIDHNYDWEPIDSLRSIAAPAQPQLAQNLFPAVAAPTAEVAANQPIPIDLNLTTAATALSTSLN
jgi:hypothetical protein